MKNYKTQFIFILFVLSALLLFGCAKSDSTTNRATTAAPPAASPAATTATTASSGEVGVPECDAFLKAYEACVHEKVPAAARATFDTQLANWKKTWHDQAANPQIKAGLAQACKSAHESAKTSMKTYGCTL